MKQLLRRLLAQAKPPKSELTTEIRGRVYDELHTQERLVRHLEQKLRDQQMHLKHDAVHR